MKTMYFLGGIVLCLSLTSLTVYAQQVQSASFSRQKPVLFQNLPSKTICTIAAIDKTFSLIKGRQIVLTLDKDLIISGEVLEKTQPDPGVENINIRCTNYNNALLSLSRITMEDGSVKYTGMLHNPDSADILMLVNEDGKYVFKKQLHSLVMADGPLPE